MKLKNTFLLMTCAIIITSCSKETIVTDGCCDPIWPIEINKDSISVGSKYNVKIGDSAEKVYADFQTYAKNNKLENLGIVRSEFTKLEEIKEILPLYSSLFMNGVQFHFEDDKVASIFTDNEKQINEWPTGYSTTIKMNDPVNIIYDKLVTISQRVNYTHLFNRFNLNNKLINMPADHSMLLSNKWYFRYELDQKTFEYVEFRFMNGVLTSIYFQEEKYK